jgi:predicted glycosyltransferase
VSRAWVDIENPPQVQYLLPMRKALEEIGFDVEVTARDYGATAALLRATGVEHRMIGRAAGAGFARKAVNVLGRSVRLAASMSRARPRVLVSASRSATLAAALLRVPSFAVIDYEYVDLRVFRRAGATVIFPDVIDAAVFERQGFDAAHRIPFAGIKEDLTFSFADVEGAPAWEAAAAPALVRVLFRPPAEQSHYYSSASGALAARVLDHLAEQETALVVFSPRYPWQVEQLAEREWRNTPVVLDQPVPALSLFKGVDLVISSGGTMLREAAHLGLPAYSIFQSKVGAVDQALARAGRLVLIGSADEVASIVIEKRSGAIGTRASRSMTFDLARAVADRVDRTPQSR